MDTLVEGPRYLAENPSRTGKLMGSKFWFTPVNVRVSCMTSSKEMRGELTTASKVTLSAHKTLHEAKNIQKQFAFAAKKEENSPHESGNPLRSGEDSPDT